ncbi:hypothetical protein BBKW_1303 [Bifidobacterium catenulatum subsp. kashiwanohense JCM 15439 = DSM 21854]|nr:hypothetical protein BBKW_1303 [Bifidobacterium catenulatum subsp. kashiwanohense JCM 15439 = DSM 21854]
MENGESKDVLPENVGTKPISSTANLAGLENDSETALQIPQGQHCESCTPSTANLAGLENDSETALQIPQGQHCESCTPSTANLAGLENDSETALQIPQGQHCESCTPSTANAAPPALQISQGCIYKDKTLQVNPPGKPSE